jgi:hypothetical protein
VRSFRTGEEMYLILESLSWMCGSSDEEAESEESSCCEMVTRENEEREQGRSRRGYLFCEHRGAWNVYPNIRKRAGRSLASLALEMRL